MTRLGASRISYAPIRVIRAIRGWIFPLIRSLLVAELSKIEIAMVASQEIHEPLVVRFRHSEQRQQLFIISTSLLQTAADQLLHLVLGNSPFRVWSGYRFPKILDNDFLHDGASRIFAGQQNVFCLNRLALNHADRALNNVFKFP